MKITVITVCLNSVNTIEKTLKSVINQGYTDLEYIVVDGGSTDGTLEILNRYGTFIDRWISEPDNGIFDAMNKGIELSTGDVIAFLNSDDWYEINTINIVAKVFIEEDFDCICCDNYVVKKDGSTVYYNATDKSLNDLYFRMIYFHSAIFCRKEFFKKKGNFNLKYKIAADYDWFLRIVRQGIRVCNIHKPVFTFCYGGISSVNEIDCAREARQIAIEHLPEDKEEYKEKIDERFYEIVLNTIDKKTMRAELIKIIGESSINILWGAGIRGNQCIKWFKNMDINIEAIIDNDELYWGKSIQNIKVYSPNILKDKLCNVIITPDKHSNDIRNAINEIRNTNINVYELKMLCRTMVYNLENNTIES